MLMLPAPFCLEVLTSLQRNGVRFAADVDLAQVAGPQTIGFTGADLSHLVRRAALSALRRDHAADSIHQADLVVALSEHRAAAQTFC